MRTLDYFNSQRTNDWGANVLLPPKRVLRRDQPKEDSNEVNLRLYIDLSSSYKFYKQSKTLLSLFRPFLINNSLIKTSVLRLTINQSDGEYDSAPSLSDEVATNPLCHSQQLILPAYPHPTMAHALGMPQFVWP